MIEYKIENANYFTCSPAPRILNASHFFTANEQHPEGNDYSGCGYGGLSQD